MQPKDLIARMSDVALTCEAQDFEHTAASLRRLATELGAEATGFHDPASRFEGKPADDTAPVSKTPGSTPQDR